MADPAQPSEALEDVSEALMAVRGEFECSFGSVDDPPENELSGVPRAIPFKQFLDGDGFLSRHLVQVWLGEYCWSNCSTSIDLYHCAYAM